MTSSLGEAMRCAAHPARPAVDLCPVCGRPRCGADAVRREVGEGPAEPLPSVGCLLCAAPPTTRAPTPTTAPPPDLERLVRAAVAAYAVALISGPVAGQYVESGLFAYLFPAVIGVGCGAAALRGGGTDGRGKIGTQVRAIAALLSVLAVGFGFALEGSQRILSSATLLPYLAAFAGAVLWTVPPRAPKTPATKKQGQGAGTEA